MFGCDLDGGDAGARDGTAEPPLAHLVQRRRARRPTVDEGAKEHPLARSEAGEMQRALSLRRRIGTEGPLTEIDLGVHVIIGRDRPNHHVSHGSAELLHDVVRDVVVRVDVLDVVGVLEGVDQLEDAAGLVLVEVDLDAWQERGVGGLVVDAGFL